MTVLFFQKLAAIFTFFFILLVQVETQGCIQKASPSGSLSINYDIIQNLQSGTFKLTNNKVSKRYNAFNITLSQQFNSSYEAAVSIQNINSFYPGSGLDFFVTLTKHSGFLKVMLVMDASSKWAWTSVCFVASARNDFGVGTFLANNADLLQANANDTLTRVHYHLPHNWNLSSQFVYAIPFVSGIRTYDLNMNFSFQDAIFNSSLNILTVVIQTNYQKYPLESLYITYLIFNMVSDLQVTSLVNLTYIPSNVNIILGVSAVGPLSFVLRDNVTQIVQALQSTSSQKQAFDMMFGVNGIVVQTQQSLDLLYLPLRNSSQQTLYCVSKSKCYMQGGVMIYEQVGVFQITSKCQICSKNAVYSQSTGSCECDKGFTAQNGSCISSALLCKTNQIYNHQTKLCICPALFAKISGQCVSILNICATGQVYFQNKCIKVVYNIPNTLNTTITTTKINNNSPATVSDSTMSKSTQKNSLSIQSSTIIQQCSEGFILINKLCVKKKICNSPFALNNATNECICPKDTQLFNGTCITCTKNETWSNSICKCKDGYFKINGKCVLCSANAYYNGVTCVCLRNYIGDGFNCALSSLLQSQYNGIPKGTYFSNGGAINLNSNT